MQRVGFELLQGGAQLLLGHVITRQGLRCGGGGVGYDAQERVRCRDALGVRKMGRQLYAETPKETFGVSLLGRCGAMCDGLLNAQPQLIQRPGLHTLREQLVGQGPLLLDEGQRQVILQMVADGPLGGLKRHAGQDALERFRDVYLHTIVQLASGC